MNSQVILRHLHNAHLSKLIRDMFKRILWKIPNFGLTTTLFTYLRRWFNRVELSVLSHCLIKMCFFVFWLCKEFVHFRKITHSRLQYCWELTNIMCCISQLVQGSTIALVVFVPWHDKYHVEFFSFPPEQEIATVKLNKKCR